MKIYNPTESERLKALREGVATLNDAELTERIVQAREALGKLSPGEVGYIRALNEYEIFRDASEAR